MDSISDSDSEDAGSIPAGVTWFVYVLQSENDSTFYMGISKDVGKRIVEHNAGKSKYTSGHRPWKLIYSEEVGTSLNARKREKYFKSAAGKKYLQKLLMQVPCLRDAFRQGFLPGSQKVQIL